MRWLGVVVVLGSFGVACGLTAGAGVLVFSGFCVCDLVCCGLVLCVGLALALRYDWCYVGLASWVGFSAVGVLVVFRLLVSSAGLVVGFCVLDFGVLVGCGDSFWVIWVFRLCVGLV